jgi:hypothetical protein
LSLTLQFFQTKIFKYYNGEQIEIDERGRGHIASMRQKQIEIEIERERGRKKRE